MYRLRKMNKKERRFLGVVGGISRYIDPTADPVLLRILYLVLVFFNPVPMILLYFGLAIVLKPEDYEILEKYPDKEDV